MNQEKPGSLHSRYNPRLEAERYIASISLNSKIRFFILIEPGLGYMIPPLKKRVPGAKIITLHAMRQSEYISRVDSSVADNAPDSEWFPETEISIRDFLEREIPDSEAREIKILEWRPALALYGKAYLSLMEEAADFIRQADANTRTVAAFGRRWFKNFFKNLEIIKTVICPFQLSVPLLVTGAGPGLEDSLIRKEFRETATNCARNTCGHNTCGPGNGFPRDRVFIMAVASSVPALKARNIIPDMVISTDGGNWARFHLYDLFRSPAYPLAAALTAALPSQCEGCSILPISDGSLWQTIILRELQIPFIILPQRGTVSASALDIAFTLTEGDVYIAGIDLANQDIRSHSRPYSLDRFLEEKEGRLNPVYSQSYCRSSMLKAGGSYGIYASWFEKQLAAYPKRLHSLGKNNPAFGLPENAVIKNIPSSIPGTETSFKTMSTAFCGDPSQKAFAVLEKALDDPGQSSGPHGTLSEKLSGELGSLLFPGRTTPPPRNELMETLYSLACSGRAKQCVSNKNSRDQGSLPHG